MCEHLVTQTWVVLVKLVSLLSHLLSVYIVSYSDCRQQSFPAKVKPTQLGFLPVPLNARIEFCIVLQEKQDLLQ